MPPGKHPQQIPAILASGTDGLVSLVAPQIRGNFAYRLITAIGILAQAFEDNGFQIEVQALYQRTWARGFHLGDHADHFWNAVSGPVGHATGQARYSISPSA